MRRRWLSHFGVVLCVLSWSVDARSQTTDRIPPTDLGRAYVEVGLVRMAGRVDALSVGPGFLPSLAVAVPVRPRWMVRFEADAAELRTTESSRRETPPAFENNQTTRTRTLAVAVSRSYGSRVVLDVMFGVGAMMSDWTRSGFSDQHGPTGQLLQRHSLDAHERKAFGSYLVGFDLKIPVSERLSIVPQFHGQKALAYARGRVFQPRVGLQWRF